jgi:hypothetical protein
MHLFFVRSLRRLKRETLARKLLLLGYIFGRLNIDSPKTSKNYMKWTKLIKSTFAGVVVSILFACAPNPVHAETNNTQSFLFIGNSFTMRHELPTLFANLSQEGNPGSTVQTEIVGYGGRNLFQHWECFHSYNRLKFKTLTANDWGKEVQEMTKLSNSKTPAPFYEVFWKELDANAFWKKFATKSKNDWEYDKKLMKPAIAKNTQWQENRSTLNSAFQFVVLQSWLDVTDDTSKGYFKYAAKFAEVAKADGARPVLYMTAPYAQNQAPVTEAVAREQAIGECKAAFSFAKTVDAIVVPVPLAITLAQESSEPIARKLTYRYVNDIHLNNTMAYLTACTFYAAIYGKTPEGLRYNKASENKVQNIHGEAVQPNDKNAPLSSLVNPDGGPLETVFTDEERIFLQKMAWAAVQKFTSGDF